MTFGWFAGALAFFHSSEFSLAYIYDRPRLGWHSWLITKPYCTAMAAACVEYAVESYLFPGVKALGAVRALGGCMVIAGEALRKVAMVTARHNFTHTIMHERREEHTLVTRGVYRYIRHPGYLGWLVWSVGTQVMLCNPVCAVGFSVVSWKFFVDRIMYEEALLIRFFGREYEEYRCRTPTWIPLID